MRRPSILLVLAALVLATPSRAAETGLPALLRLLPQPSPGALQPGQPMLAYARADLIARARGPTAAPGHSRLGAIVEARAAAFAAMPLGTVAAWPSASGFDLDAIEAALVLETGALPAGIRLFVGARMPGLAELAGPLAARGFAPGRIGGAGVLTRGADDGFNPRHRMPPDILGGSLGLSLRLAVPAPGVLLATRSDATMGAALASAGRSLADMPEMQALAAHSAGGPDGRELAQALVLAGGGLGPPAMLVEDPQAAAERLAAGMRDTATMPGPPPWRFAMLSERRDAQGIVTRLALPYRSPQAAEAAVAAMVARLVAMPAPPGLAAMRGEVLAGGADGILVAVLEARQPADAATTLLQAVQARHHAGEPTPMTIGPVPRAAMAR